MARSTRTRQSSKPVNRADVGRWCRTRRAKKLMAMAPIPIQHCCIMNGMPGCMVSNLSCSTAPREVMATAAVRWPRPRNHLLSGHSPPVLKKPPPEAWPRATISERQKPIVATTTATTRPYWSLVCLLPSTTRVSPTVIAMAKAFPTRLKVPTSRCCMEVKLRMSPQVKRVVVSMKRQIMLGWLSCLIPSRPLATAVPTPRAEAVAHAWNVSAGTMKGKVPPLARFTQSSRMGPEALTTTYTAQSAIDR
mmetsp:Transcript_51088/g.150644  ORF Transcript_51088/g.150644 Transcript_51088/m.150644 type:complete len:249 (+) Transcript_51088:304-1050(+)